METPTYNPASQTLSAKWSHCDGAYAVFQYLPNYQVQLNENKTIKNNTYTVLSYMLFRCPGCNHGALAVIRHTGNLADPTAGRTYLESFHPFAGDAAPLPLPKLLRKFNRNFAKPNCALPGGVLIEPRLPCYAPRWRRL